MPQLSTAARLLAEIHKQNSVLVDAVAGAAGISFERARDASTGGARLTPAEQVRLADATKLLVPVLARRAAALRAQALAALSYEAGDVSRHVEGSSERWERSAALRR